MSFPTEITPLTPSEVVLLNGERFASKGGMLDKYKLLNAEMEVSKKQLALQAFAAAFIASQSSGDLRLEVREKKTLFGLHTIAAIYAEPVSGQVAWPAASLENGIFPLAQKLREDKRQNEVKNIVHSMFADDVVDPFNEALEMIQRGLATRGLLEVSEKKKLKVFTVHQYLLPPGTAELASAQAETVQKLIGEYQSCKSDAWTLLSKQIQSGIASRTQKQDPEDSS